MPERDDDADDDRRREDAAERTRRREDDDRYDREDRPQRRGGMSGLAIGLIVGGVLALVLCILVAGGALFFSVGKVRDAASRMKEQNNLKQIALAMHSDESVNGRGIYAPYVHDEKHNIHKGLSFRVHMLPYLEQESLYRSFDLTQAYDSPRNSAQSNTIIMPLQSAVAPQGANTPYRVFVGGGALFNEDGKPVSLSNIPDGTSNTIMFIYAAESVPWAKPQELRYGKGIPLPQFGHPSYTAGVPVAFADGSVRMMKLSESEQTVRSLIERADGQVVNLDW